MDILATIRRLGLSRGVVQGNRAWLVLGACAWAWKGLRWALRPAPETVFRGRLNEGETLVITDLGRPVSRRRQRRIRRDAHRELRRDARRDVRRGNSPVADGATGPVA